MGDVGWSSGSGEAPYALEYFVRKKKRKCQSVMSNSLQLHGL